MSDLLKLQDAQALYGLKQTIKLKFKAGQFISLLGMNGSGKSSLLKLICGLNYQSGLLHIQGRPIHSLPALERARLLSYLPQDSPVSQHWTVHELIKQGLYPHQGLKSVHECNSIVHRICTQLCLNHLLHRPLIQLSGGEKQKALLARLLVQDTQIILLDEPLSALDWPRQESILQILKQHCIQNNALVIMVLHDLNLAALYSDQLLLLKQGKVLVQDSPKNLLDSPLIESCFETKPLTIQHPRQAIAQILPRGL